MKGSTLSDWPFADPKKEKEQKGPGGLGSIKEGSLDNGVSAEKGKEKGKEKNEKRKEFRADSQSEFYSGPELKFSRISLLELRDLNGAIEFRLTDQSRCLK